MRKSRKGTCQYCHRDNMNLRNTSKEDICNGCASRRRLGLPIGNGYVPKTLKKGEKKMAKRSAYREEKGTCDYCHRPKVTLMATKKEKICTTCYNRKLNNKPLGIQYMRIPKRAGIENMPKIKLAERAVTHSVELDSFGMNLDEKTIRALVIEYAQVCAMDSLKELSKEALKYKLSKVTLGNLITGAMQTNGKRPYHHKAFKRFDEWTPAEDAKVLREYIGYELKDNYAVRERLKINKRLAKDMGRSKAAISWRYYKLKNDSKSKPSSEPQISETVGQPTN